MFANNTVGYTERTYRLHRRRNGSTDEFAWIYSDTREAASPIFYSAREALTWAEKRAGDTHVEITSMKYSG